MAEWKMHCGRQVTRKRIYNVRQERKIYTGNRKGNGFCGRQEIKCFVKDRKEGHCDRQEREFIMGDRSENVQYCVKDWSENVL